MQGVKVAASVDVIGSEGWCQVYQPRIGGSLREGRVYLPGMEGYTSLRAGASHQPEGRVYRVRSVDVVGSENAVIACNGHPQPVRRHAAPQQLPGAGVGIMVYGVGLRCILLVPESTHTRAAATKSRRWATFS